LLDIHVATVRTLLQMPQDRKVFQTN
jgi:hypothetical protein